MSPHALSHPPFPGILRHPATRMAALALLAACSDSPSASAPRDCGDGDLRLDVGQAAALPENVSCVLRAEQGAEYALAWFDTQLLEVARTGREPYAPGVDERFSVTLVEGDGSARADAAPAPALALRALPADARSVAAVGPRRAMGVEGYPGPWSPGDVIQFGAPLCGPTCGGRVARVVDGWLVLVLDEATLGAGVDGARAMLDEAIPHFRQHVLPMLRETFTAELPVTGPESGQLVVVVTGNVTGVGGNAFTTTFADGTATHVLRVEVEPGMHAGLMLGTLAHEVAHAFQAEFGVRTAPAGQGGDRPGARWGIEGGATLIESEALRRASGRPFAGNVEFRAAPASIIEQAFFRHAGLDNGGFTGGYHSASSLLLDLVDRRTRAGDDLATALREVSRGAVEGWYGHTIQPPPRQGLVRRMQARISGWDPEDAVFTWTFSAAADDVLAGDTYQNRAWLRVNDTDLATSLGWRPFRQVTGGSNVTVQFSRAAGTPGWIRLVDAGAGVTVRVRTQPSVHWRLLRIR